MSVFREKFIKRSQKNRRCVGCDNFVTIRIGDPYYSCFFADGGDSGSYAMCEPCHDHANDCKECREAWNDGEPRGIHECRRESEKAIVREPQD